MAELTANINLLKDSGWARYCVGVLKSLARVNEHKQLVHQPQQTIMNAIEISLDI